jgi:hypothetical protein
MRRRGGGGGTSSHQSSSSNSGGIIPSRMAHQYDSINERLRTIILTSLIWTLILSVTLFFTIRYYSTTNCPQNNLIKSK